MDPAGEADVEREFARRERVVDGQRPDEPFGVTEIVDALDVGVGPKVRAELEAGLRDETPLAERRVHREPAVEPLALDPLTAFEDRGEVDAEIDRAFAEEEGGLDEGELERTAFGPAAGEALTVKGRLVEFGGGVPADRAIREEVAPNVGRCVVRRRSVDGRSEERRVGKECRL